jgi:uncharacterized membrane protein (DUF373 family)
MTVVWYITHMKRETLLAEIMNYIVSGYVYFVAITLVFYMVSSLVTGVLSVATGLLNISTSVSAILSAPERDLLELDLLHTIAFTIVLVKAYKILISYAQKRHVSIKYLVEIAIIAPTIEIVFNSTKYPIEVNILFAVFAFANLIAYLFFYSTIKHVSNDYDHDMCEPPEPVKVVKVATKTTTSRKKTT